MSGRAETWGAEGVSGRAEAWGAEGVSGRAEAVASPRAPVITAARRAQARRQRRAVGLAWDRARRWPAPPLRVVPRVIPLSRVSLIATGARDPSARPCAAQVPPLPVLRIGGPGDKRCDVHTNHM